MEIAFQVKLHVRTGACTFCPALNTWVSGCSVRALFILRAFLPNTDDEHVALLRARTDAGKHYCFVPHPMAVGLAANGCKTNLVNDWIVILFIYVMLNFKDVVAVAVTVLVWPSDELAVPATIHVPSAAVLALHCMSVANSRIFVSDTFLQKINSLNTPTHSGRAHTPAVSPKHRTKAWRYATCAWGICDSAVSVVALSGSRCPARPVTWTRFIHEH
jgi:hypothetical protein